MRPSLAAVLGSWLLLCAVWGVAFVLVAPVAAATPEPEVIVITATPYRCANGDVLGSSTACPMAILNVGPTSTPDPYNVPALAADGSTFLVHRGGSYLEIWIAAAVTVGVLLFGVSLLLRGLRGG
jgi:hypothetical protein